MNPKLPSRLLNDPRLDEAGEAALGVFVKLWLYLGSNDGSTDGVVPDKATARLIDDPETLDRLIKARLVERVAKGDTIEVEGRTGRLRDIEVIAPASGYLVREFLLFNYTGEEWRQHSAEQSRKAQASHAPDSKRASSRAPARTPVPAVTRSSASEASGGTKTETRTRTKTKTGRANGSADGTADGTAVGTADGTANGRKLSESERERAYLDSGVNPGSSESHPGAEYDYNPGGRG